MIDVAKQASIAADRARFQHWGSKLPVDPARIAGSLGIKVVEAYLDPDVAGAIEQDPGEQATIYVSATDHANRKRFTCAHEIGHFLRHGDSDEALGHIDYRDEVATKGIDEDERYTNTFAAALLMPEHEIEQMVFLGCSEEEMALRFGVSKVAMVNRLRNLGLYR
jgi:Zn-dependent peptidase ImmA (M78 family)